MAMKTLADPPDRQRGDCCLVPADVDTEWATGTAGLLKVLAEPTRLAMFACLFRADTQVCVCDFTSIFNLTQPTISHHMGKLKEAGLVSATKRGIWSYYSVRRDLDPATRRLLTAVVATSRP